MMFNCINVKQLNFTFGKIYLNNTYNNGVFVQRDFEIFVSLIQEMDALICVQLKVRYNRGNQKP